MTNWAFGGALLGSWLFSGQTGVEDPPKGKEVFGAYSTVIGAAYPAAGAVFKATGEFLDLCGYFGTSADPVAEALKRINERLDALEARMGALEAAVAKVQNEVFRNANLARVRQLRSHRRALQGVIVRLQQAPSDKAIKVALAHDAQVIAEEFMVDEDLWTWSDLALKDHSWQGMSVKAGRMLDPDFKPWPSMEYYTLALFTWMTAIEHAGAGDMDWIKETYGSELQRHVAFLSIRPGWTPLAGPAKTLPENIRGRVQSWFSPDRYPENLICHFHEYTEDKIVREIKYVHSIEYRARADDELCAVPDGFLNQATTAEEELERSYGTGLMWLLAEKLARLKKYGTMREQFVGTFAPPGRTIVPAVIYAIRPDGRLSWHRHDGATEGHDTSQAGAWVGGAPVSDGWGSFKQVLPGGGNVMHAITRDGKFLWYRHGGFNTGARREWEGGKDVGADWNSFKHVFSGGNGVIYAITHEGKLLYYRHSGHKDGARVWEPVKEVGSDWGGFKTVFSGGDGIVYAVTYEGRLLWYKQIGFAQGAKSWQGPKEVKTVGTENWADYKHVFSAGPRLYGTPSLPRVALDKMVIYAIDAEGKLFWYGHRGYNVGASFLDDRRQVGDGWGEFISVFALLPDALDVVR